MFSKSFLYSALDLLLDWMFETATWLCNRNLLKTMDIVQNGAFLSGNWNLATTILDGATLHLAIGHINT